MGLYKPAWQSKNINRAKKAVDSNFMSEPDKIMKKLLWI